MPYFDLSPHSPGFSALKKPNFVYLCERERGGDDDDDDEELMAGASLTGKASNPLPNKMYWCL